MNRVDGDRHLRDLDTPTAVVDLDRLEANLGTWADRIAAHGVGLRPHVKTHKTVEITRMQLEHGATGITVAKLSELPPLLASGVTDVLVAYPIVGATKIATLLTLSTRLLVRTCIDDLGAATALSEAAVEAGQVLEVLIDVDTGLHRTGLPPEAAVELGKQAAGLPGLRIAGVFSYAGYPQRSPDPDERRAWALQEASGAVAAARALQDAGLEAPTVSVAGTATAEFAAGVEGVTEVRPGTYVFGDANTTRLGVAAAETCALTVLAQVIGRSRDRVVLDAGTKALTSDLSVAEHSFGHLPGAPDVRLSRIWEEHAVAEAEGVGETFRVADRLHVVPNHVCPAVNLFDELVCVRGDTIVDRWSIVSRGRLH